MQALKVQPCSGAVLALDWKYWAPVANVGLPATLLDCSSRHVQGEHALMSNIGTLSARVAAAVIHLVEKGC